MKPEIVGHTMKFVISSGFGATESFRKGKEHTGVDVPLDNGTELHSPMNGVVEKVIDLGDSSPLGKGVIVKYESGETGVFGHLSEIAVKEGQPVTDGQLLGQSGNSGNVIGENGGYHLHYGLKSAEDGKFIDGANHVSDIITHSESNNGFWKSLLDGWNSLGDKVIGWQIEQVGKPAVYGIENFFSHLADNITFFLPDILAIVTILFGFYIMWGWRIPRALAYYMGILTFAVGWLINASS